MAKKGQITIFVIIAIVVIAGIIGVSILVKNGTISFNNLPSNIVPIRDYFQSCFDNSLEDSLLLVGARGGYTILPERNLVTNSSGGVAYAYYSGSTLLSEKELKNQISSNMEAAMKICLETNNFSDYKISSSASSATIALDASKVTATLNYPVVVTKEDSSWNINTPYKTQQNIRLGNLYAITTNIVQQISENPDSIEVSYLTDLDYNVTIVSYPEEQYLYYLVDTKNTLGGNPYIYRFAVKI